MAERLLSEFVDETAMIVAIRRLQDAGFRRLETYMPFPSHEVEDALGHPLSRLPIAVFFFGMCGAGAAYFLQWLLVAYLYPLDVGSRPPHFPLAFVIITFEMGVLAASACSFLGPLVLGKLFRLTDDVQGLPGFESVTRDAFWLEVSSTEPEYDREKTRRLLLDSGALRVEEAP